MRVSPRALLVLRGGALSAIAVAFAAATAPAPARVVRVDVIASDARGRIVGTLKPADFDVIENGAPQALEDVRFVKVDGRDAADAELTPIRSEFDEQAEAARDGTRLFAILLDEYHVSAGANTDRAREAMTGFVDRDLGPRDLVALFKPLDSLLTIRVTRDHDLLRHAIETFEGRKGDYEPRNAFERNFIAGAPARIDQVRTQVVLSALNALVVHLGKLSDGRKAVLVVGEGLGRAARRRGLEGLPTADSVIRAANRYNVSIYAIDPQLPPDAADGNRPADRPASDVDTLRTIAEGTDGRASSAGHLAETMRQMVDDSSGYYLLTYRSAPPNDGKFREVQVRVKRPGVRVRARKGYGALWPDEALAAEMLAKGDAPAGPPLPAAFALPWRTSPLIRPWFGVSRGDDGKTRVTFVWEPAPRVPGDRTRRAVPARIALTAFSPDGTQLFDGMVCVSGISRCASDRAEFDVPAGRIRLRMSIEDDSEQVIDSDVREMSVRDLKG